MSGIGVALTPSPAFDASNCARNLRRLMHRAGCAPYSRPSLQFKYVQTHLQTVVRSFLPLAKCSPLHLGLLHARDGGKLQGC